MIRRYALPLALVAVLALAVPAWAATYNPDDSDGPSKLRIELTGYSDQDNTPANSTHICCGVIHRRAGGEGTYSNPITVAVPGSGSDVQFAKGTRFYLPTIRRYVIVEDSGATRMSLPHLDVWIDGRTGTRADTDDCMDELTGRVTAIRNPGRGYPVIEGPVYAHGRCRIP